MSYFYGRIQGNRGEVTRAGTSGSGMTARLNTWHDSVETFLYVDQQNRFDCMRVKVTDMNNCTIILYDGPIAELFHYSDNLYLRPALLNFPGENVQELNPRPIEARPRHILSPGLEPVQEQPNVARNIQFQVPVFE